MPASTDQTILSASSFVNSIGVTTHAGYSWGGYANLALMQDDLKYLGVTHLRDGLTTNANAQPVLDGLAAAGYTFDMVVSSGLPATGAAGLQQYIVQLNQFAANHPGSIVAIEGLNEANSQPFSYNGSSSLSAAAQFQSALYNAVNANASLSDIPVYNLSLSYNDLNDFAKLGNMSGATDYANSHAYVSTGTTPQSAIAAALAAAGSAAPGRPLVITETGYTTQANTPYLGVDQRVQATSILNTLADAFKAGVGTTYLYELLDRNSSSSDTNSEDHFGLFNSDGSPKLAASAIHNLTTILGDDGTGGHQPTASLNYTLGGLPSSGNSMVLGKSNGAYDLVVWAEPRVWDSATSSEVVNPAQSVTVNLGGIHHSVNVYDPMSGTTAIASYTDVSSITIAVTDHPVVIEIDAPPPAVSGGGDTGAHVSGTAADIVAQLSDLNASDTLQTITLTDTHTLPVASVATMNYMMSHYGHALAAIQGGYNFSITTSAANWTKTVVYDAAGRVLSTSNTGLSNGVPVNTNIVYADGSTDNISYSGGVKTKLVHLANDGTRTTDSFDNHGVLTTEVVQKPDGFYSTTLYSGGHKTKAYVVNADHSQDNYTYNITGQSYTTQVQHLDASGRVTSVTRTHADGSLDYSQVINSDGSSVVSNYNATGVKILETDTHADHSRDVFTYHIAGQTYTTEHDSYDATGFLTSIVRSHADGSLAFKLVQTRDGGKTTDWYDAKGVLTSEVVQRADGYYSTTVYTGGVKTKAYVLNADHSQDNYTYNITGQSYTTQVQHIDPTGRVTAVTRTHADGTLDYSQVINSDGSSAISNYNAAGVKMKETDTHADGSREVFTYNIAGQAYATEHDSYDATGFLGTIVRSHADGSLAFKLIQTRDGTQTTDWYDARGSLTSEVLQKADGSGSTTLYSAGVRTSAFVTNADHTQDNYTYNITGQSYTTQVQHLDVSGHVLSVTRTHADGSLDYTQVNNSDGSSAVSNYNATGVKMLETDTHADHSRDVFTYNITGQAYTSEHDSYDASGSLTAIVRTHSDGSLAFHLAQTSDAKTTDWYDASGVLTSETVQRADGSGSTTLYTGGVRTSAYITNADHTQDNFVFNITGQSYTTQQQHLDAAGHVVSVLRTHADGTFDFSQITNSDGSRVTDLYDSTGHRTQETINNASGSTDVFKFVVAGSPGAVEHDSYNSAGKLQAIDIQNSNGTHTVTAATTGVTLTGGSGNDTFWSAGSTTMVNSGNDLIYNFVAGTATNHDTIQIAQSLATDYSHLQISQNGNDTLVQVSANDSILLKNVLASHLSSSDFIFV